MVAEITVRQFVLPVPIAAPPIDMAPSNLDVPRTSSLYVVEDLPMATFPLGKYKSPANETPDVFASLPLAYELALLAAVLA